MYRFNQQRINAVEGESRKPKTNKNCYGFTLIELLVAISIIAILIGLLLPVIQTKREEYAANKATQNLTALIEASDEYFRRMGSYPNTIAELVQFCGANPGSCSLDPQLASGKTGGYLYTLTKMGAGTLEFEAEPEIPGITGSITHTYDSDLRLIASTPTPGSDAARQRAFDNILASGAATVVQLLKLDTTGAATSEARGYVGATTVNAGTLTSVFTSVDFNHDGMVSVQEVSGQGAGDPIPTEEIPFLLGSFLGTVSRELRLDTLEGQADQDIAVTMEELVTTRPSLFSFDELQHLTRIVVNGGAGDDMLAAKLQAAEDAEASGNLNRKAKSLKQYKKRVNKLIGTSVTRANANTLIALADCMGSS